MSITLYRCKTPTDHLCVCGKVARKLDELGIGYQTARVSYRRSSRPDIEKISDQQYVPVLVDGEKVVSDSKRILEYLDKHYGPKRTEQ